MPVDRRALRRFPGRKRQGRHRRAAALIPITAPVRTLQLAVSSEQLCNVTRLHAAFEYDQKELLRAFEEDRRTRIRAVQSVFVLMGAGRLDYIKRLVWSFLDRPTIWQFLDEAGWKDCHDTTQEALNEAERGGLENVRLRISNGHIYFYDLIAMTQMNCLTGKMRAMRRGNPWTVTAALPRWQYETRTGWSDCDLQTQQLLADAVLEGETTQTAVVHRIIRGIMYALDFVALTQTNVQTGRVRALRFGA